MEHVQVSPGEFVRCVLQHFEYLSVKRFHILSFLCEVEYRENTGVPVTSVEYELVLDGCYSEALQEAVESLADMTVKDVSLKGQQVRVIDVTGSVDCDVPELVATSIGTTVDAYSEVTEDELFQELRETDAYRDANFQSPIVLSPVTTGPGAGEIETEVIDPDAPVRFVRLLRGGEELACIPWDEATAIANAVHNYPDTRSSPDSAVE